MFPSILAVGILAFIVIAIVMYVSEDKPKVPTVDLWPDPRVLQALNLERGTPVTLTESSRETEVKVFGGDTSEVPLGTLKQKFIYDMVHSHQLKAKVYAVKKGLLTLELLHT